MKENKFMEHYKYFQILCVLYTLFFTFSLYKNKSGIMIPIFVIGSLFFINKFLNKVGKKRKKESLFYEISMIMIGLSTFITLDRKIIFLNDIALFVLVLSYLLYQFYDFDQWKIPDYLGEFKNIVFGSIGMVFRPFLDFNETMKEKEKSQEDGNKKKHRILYILIGGIIALPLCFIVIVLLSSADRIFLNTMEFLWKNISLPENLVGILFMLVLGYFSSYSIMAYLLKNKKMEKEKKEKQGEAMIAITFTSILALIYFLFCFIQIRYLFMNDMGLPSGYSYASYAREGFFQLMLVCLINLSLVLFCMFYYNNSKPLKILLTIISFCTYLLMISSAFRMILYIKAYHLTFLRIFVLWVLLVIGFLMTAIIITIWNGKFPLLKYSIFITTILFLLLSFSHPDYFIANYNYGYRENIGSKNTDTTYLYELSGDAAPVIEKYAKEICKDAQSYDNIHAYEEIENYFERITRNKNNWDIRTFNLSGFLANKAKNEFLNK